MRWIIIKDYTAMDHTGDLGLKNRIGVGAHRSLTAPNTMPELGWRAQLRNMTYAEAEAKLTELLAAREAEAGHPIFTHELQLRDDDGNPCYLVLCEGLDNADAEAAFEPQYWAEQDVGVTNTWYRPRGSNVEWSQL